MTHGPFLLRLGAFFLPFLAASCASTVGPTPSPAPAPAPPAAASPIPAADGPAPARSRPRVVAYVPNWISYLDYPASLDYEKLTHINLAFENPVNTAGDLSYQPVNTAILAQARARGVKVLVSVAGGNASEDKVMRQKWFTLISPAKRKAFAARLYAYVEKHGFDGLDLDLEGPAINADYDAFVAELSPLFQKGGKLLTAALSQGYGGSRVSKECLTRFDYVNLMAYNASGPWKPKQVGPHASLEFARSCVAWWTKLGLPRDRLMLGVPFYGQGFGAAATRDETGIPYRVIVTKNKGAENSDQAGKVIWYNGLPTIRAKCELVRNEGLGGIMIWSLDQDAPGDKSLLKAIHETLNPPTHAPAL